MGISDYTLEGMTIAVTNMDPMLEFYSHVFQIQFEEKDMFGAKLYAGNWGGLKLLLCPAELAGNTATQNRHQFDIRVGDLEKTLEIMIQYGGKPMGEIQEGETGRSVGVYDPDHNSMVLKEAIKRNRSI